MNSNISTNEVGPIAACRKQLRAAGFSATVANAKIGEWLKGSSGNLLWIQAKVREFLQLVEANKKRIEKDAAVQKKLTTRPRAKRKKGRRKSNKPKIIYSGFESSRRRH